MNPFAAMARPIIDRPGDPEPEPPRAPRVMPSPNHLPVVDNPWGLTPTQCEVMRRVVDGEKAKEIGDALCRSHKTVEVHFERAKEKMGARSILHAAVMWARHFPQREGTS